MWYQLFNICLSVQRGLMPRILQIAAKVMKTDARFSCFVSPQPFQCKCIAGNWHVLGWWTHDSARKTSGNCINIRSTFIFYEFFDKLGQCCFECTQWKSFFYFRVVYYAICKVGMMNAFSNHVLEFVYSLSLLRSQVSKLSSFKREF